VDLEILAALKRPDMFQRLVDSLPPSPTRVSLRLWGLLYGVYTLSDKTQSEVCLELEQSLPVHNSGRPVDGR
jgi:hypothetical protein